MGTVCVVLSAVPDLIGAFNGDVRPESYYHWGLLGFMVFLIYIAERHFEETRDKLEQTREQYADARRELERARLKSLQDRMSPHFLFNSLNTIHAMLHIDTKAADQALISLADHYRFLTDQPDRQLIPFQEEWRFLENYLDLNRLRFRDSLSFTLQQHGHFDDIQIPPLILQPLVENAVQHGLRSRPGEGHIHIHARRQGHRLLITIDDDGVGLNGAETNPGRSGGTLENLRSRLGFHFASARLVLQDRTPAPGVRASVYIRLREAV